MIDVGYDVYKYDMCDYGNHQNPNELSIIIRPDTGDPIIICKAHLKQFKKQLDEALKNILIIEMNGL